MKKITIKSIDIDITGIGDDDFISLTDIARFKNEEDPNAVIANWLRRVDSIQFLAIWEKLNNEQFKPTDFEGFKSKPGENAFTISPKKWIDITNAVGIKVKSGRHGGGTFAHRDIAFEFASWISPEVKLYIIKEFQRLKIQESEQIEWQGKRLATLLAQNYIEECQKGDKVNEWSLLHEYDNYYFPKMNLMITGKCNLNCLHCFNAKDNAPLNTELSYEDVLNILDQAKEIGVHAFS